MLKPPVDSGRCVLFSAVFVLASIAVAPSFAQPGNNSPGQFGDRQVGNWGDPGQGHFGNPAVGDFDKAQIIEPPPGAKPLGRVQIGKSAQASPYVSLPAPTDAAPAEVDAKPVASPKKKPAKKRAVKQKTSE